MNLPHRKGRGTTLNPVNRFESIAIDFDPEWLESGETVSNRTIYYDDTTRTILSENDSPDIPFVRGLNPYRGCEHGCIYCYARPSHEYFGLSSGLDFETKIMVKREAPRLLAEAFQNRNWKPQVIALSGNTDCYQLAERKLRITRGCLEVLLRFRNPVGIITKNALILRDLDLLQELARLQLVHVTLSVTTLDHELRHKMEPRTSAPERRLEALAQLAAAGIPTSVNVAPIIPGLNDHEMPAIIAAAAARGATGAGFVMLRLPYALKELFENWLRTHFPDRAEKVLSAIRDTRNGKLYDARFGTRMSGEGERAEAIARLFEVTCQKHGLNQRWQPLRTDLFRRIGTSQKELFEDGETALLS
ncbi:MAG: PA0069 family radical SAM protein [bacterium]